MPAVCYKSTAGISVPCQKILQWVMWAVQLLITVQFPLITCKDTCNSEIYLSLCIGVFRVKGYISVSGMIGPLVCFQPLLLFFPWPNLFQGPTSCGSFKAPHALGPTSCPWTRHFQHLPPTRRFSTVFFHFLKETSTAVDQKGLQYTNI